MGIKITWRIIWGFLKKSKTRLLYDPAIPLPGMYLNKLKLAYARNICILMFIAALPRIAKIWNQPDVHQWTDGLIN